MNFLENEESESKNVKLDENEEKYLNELKIKYFELLSNYNKLKIEEQVIQNMEVEMNKNFKGEDDSIEIGK